MTSRARKNTSEINRERALEVLRLYESGVKPKELAEQYGRDANWVWLRIKLARLTRARNAQEAAE